VSMLGDAEGTVALSASDPGTMSFDDQQMRLAVVDGNDLVTVSAKQLRKDRPSVRRMNLSRLDVRDARTATFDPSTSTWYVLDTANDRIATARIGARRVTAAGSIPLDAVGGDVRAIAFNASDGRLYVATTDMLMAIGRDGRISNRSRLGSLRLKDLRAMTFAPSADTTDDPGTLDLYLVDAGSTSRNGRVIEARQASAPSQAAVAETVSATLVQRIDTSGWSPASPDPSGVAWIPSIDRLWVVDSEVDEVTGAGYHGVNMWQLTRAGVVTDTGTACGVATSNNLCTQVKWGGNAAQTAGSKEPTGAAYDPNANALLMSDDSANRVWIDKPGTDGRFGTGDDVVSAILASSYGIADDEDPEYYSFPGRPQTGHIFFLDGINTEVYDIDPVNGVFGDGNDVATHFDVGKFGPTDFEGLAMDPVTGNLYVGQRDKTSGAQAIFEVTPTGDLVRTISVYGLRASGLTFVSGLAVAPATDGSGRMDIWIVDRAVDNGPNASENDGKLWEVSVPASGTPVDTAPTAVLTAPSGGSTLSGTVQVTATATDDHGVTQVEFLDGSTVIGTDTDGSNGWSTSWDTTTASEGAHQLAARATDNATPTPHVTTSAAVNVTVTNAAAPPTVSITSPAANAIVRNSVTITATASAGTATVEFFDGSTSLGIDTDGSNGWSVSWNTNSASDGAHQLKAVATDTANATATSALVPVTVDNTAPSVSITSPNDGAQLSGTVAVTANAADGAGTGVASVEFFAGSASIGTDTDPSGGWSIQWNTAGVPNGPYSLTARATDRASNTATSAAISVTTTNAVATGVLDVPIRASSDDAEERSPKGNMELTSTDLDMMTDSSNSKQAIGLRFTNVTIPRGATVTSAYVQFQTDQAGSGATTLQIRAQATDNPSTFTTTKSNISSRPRTTASVTWTPVAWPTVGARGPDQRTPNLKAVLEEVFGRNGWGSGNSLVLILTGSGNRTAEAWDETNANAIEPVLHIEYTA
jgi:hypothetical protein